MQASDLVDGYTFNTELILNGVAQTVTVSGSGPGATFVGSQTTGTGTGNFASACNVRYPTLIEHAIAELS